MAKTLQQILIEVNAVLDLDASMPIGGDLITRANYANQAVWDAAALGQLREFRTEFSTTTSSSATIPLPSNFKEMHSGPRVSLQGGWKEIPVVEAEDKYFKTDSETYCYVLGDAAGGYNLITNGVSPDETLTVVYQKYPQGLLTLTDKCELPDPQYVVRYVEAQVLYGRSDDRFLVAEQKAQQLLANMMGRGMKSSSGQGRTTRVSFDNPLS